MFWLMIAVVSNSRSLTVLCYSYYSHALFITYYGRIPLWSTNYVDECLFILLKTSVAEAFDVRSYGRRFNTRKSENKEHYLFADFLH